VCRLEWPGDHYVGERAFGAQPRSIVRPDSQVPSSSAPNSMDGESDEMNSDEDG
jgi:hypothetical protein